MPYCWWLLAFCFTCIFLAINRQRWVHGCRLDIGIAGDLKVAYINSDSVLKNYDYLKANRVQMEAKTKKMEQEYRNRAQGLQNEITAYQRNVTNMTLGQVKAVEEDLGKKQQNLQMYQQSLSQQLMEEEAKLNKELYDRVTAYLKKYANEKESSCGVKI